MAVAKKKQKTAATGAKEPAAASDKGDFLKLFWTLAESDRAARTQAAARILAHLRAETAGSSNGKADGEGSKVQYTLKRLVRGLASSRDAARQGFSAALAGLLREFAALSLADTRALLHEAMEVHSSMRGMEQREHMFGRLFGLLALHRSGRLGADRALQVQVVKELLEMAAWKKWFREACFEGALAIVAEIPTDVFIAELAGPIAALLPSGDNNEWNADQVLLAVGIQHYIATQKVTAEQLGDVENAGAFTVVRRKHMHVLAEPLRASAGNYPRVHSAWLGVFGHILHTGSSDKEVVDGELFQEAWSVLVENALLGGSVGTEGNETTGTTTHARRGLAFKLLELAAPRLPRPLLRAVLTPRLVKCLYNNSVAKKNYLHDAARHCVKAFASHARAECVHFFAKQFVSPMPTLLENAADGDEEQEEELKKEKQEALKRGGFDAIIAIEEEKERAEQRQKRVDSVRLWALDAVVAALTESLTKEDESNTKPFNQDETLRFLVAHALFAPSASSSTPNKKNKKKKSSKKSDAAASDLLAELGAPTPALSANVVGYSKKRLFALLGLGLSTSSSGSDANNTTSSVLARVYSISQALMGEEMALRKSLGDENDEAALTTSVRDLVTSIVSTRLPVEQDTRTRQQLEAFQLLLMSTSVQLLDAEQRDEAVVVATDLLKCFSELLDRDADSKGKKKKSKKKDEEPEAEADEKTDSIVVLTDMLLSLLSQDSSAMREIVTHVFRSILPLLNAESLATMVAVLAPSPEGEEGGHHDEKDEDEAMEEEEEEEEVVLSSAEDVSTALRSDEKLAELHREDLALAAIVGQVKDKAQRKKDARVSRLQRLHFQLRVLDLLQVFATSSSANASQLVVLIVRPLIEALAAIGARDTERRVLRERLEAVLIHKVLRSKESAVLGEDKEASAAEAEAIESLAAVVTLLSTRPLDKDHAGKVAATAVVYYVRVLCGHADLGAATMDKRLARVSEILAPAVTETFTKKHARFPRSVFDDLIAKFPAVAVRVLLPPLAAIAEAKDEGEARALDEFSQCEVFRLLALLVRPKQLAHEAEAKAFAGVRVPLTAATARVLSEDAPKKSKRLKLVLSFALQLVKAWGATEAASKPKSKALAPLLAALEALETSSPVIKSMVKQVVAAAAGDAAEDAKKPTKAQETPVEEEEEEELLPEKKATKPKKSDKKKRKRAQE